MVLPHMLRGGYMLKVQSSLSPPPTLPTPPTSTHAYKKQDSEGFMLDMCEMCVPFQEGQPSNIRSNSLRIHPHYSASLSECLGPFFFFFFFCQSKWSVQIDNVSNCLNSCKENEGPWFIFTIYFPGCGNVVGTMHPRAFCLVGKWSISPSEIRPSVCTVFPLWGA